MNSQLCYLMLNFEFLDTDFSLQELEDDIHKIGLQIGEVEKKLDKLNVDKAEIEEVLQTYQGFE